MSILFPILLLRNICNISVYYNCVFNIFEYVLFVLILFNISTFNSILQILLMHDYCRVSIRIRMRFRIYSFYNCYEAGNISFMTKHCNVIFGQERTNIITEFRGSGLKYYETIFGQERTNISLKIGNYQETDDF